MELFRQYAGAFTILSPSSNWSICQVSWSPLTCSTEAVMESCGEATSSTESSWLDVPKLHEIEPKIPPAERKKCYHQRHVIFFVSWCVCSLTDCILEWEETEEVVHSQSYRFDSCLMFSSWRKLTVWTNWNTPKGNSNLSQLKTLTLIALQTKQAITKTCLRGQW